MKYMEGVNVHDRSELQMLPLFIRVKTAGEIANVSDRYVRELCSQEVVRSKKFGREWRVDRDSWLEYLGLSEPSRPEEPECQ